MKLTREQARDAARRLKTQIIEEGRWDPKAPERCLPHGWRLPRIQQSDFFPCTLTNFARVFLAYAAKYQECGFAEVELEMKYAAKARRRRPVGESCDHDGKRVENAADCKPEREGRELIKCGGTGRPDLDAMDAAVAKMIEVFRIAKEKRERELGRHKQHNSAHAAVRCPICNPHGHSFHRYKQIMDEGGDPSRTEEAN